MKNIISKYLTINNCIFGHSFSLPEKYGVNFKIKRCKNCNTHKFV